MGVNLLERLEAPPLQVVDHSIDFVHLNFMLIFHVYVVGLEAENVGSHILALLVELSDVSLLII